MTGVKNVIVNWPQTKEGMEEVQRRFTIALARIVWETMSPRQVDLVIEGLKKNKWDS